MSDVWYEVAEANTRHKDGKEEFAIRIEIILVLDKHARI
jgi:hypothetical protein